MQEYHIYSSLAMDEVLEVFLKESPAHLKPLDLGKGVSAFNVFDHVDIQLTPKELSAHTSYGDVNGLQRLRRAIADYYGEKFNYDLNPNRICITDGASGALTIAFALLTANGGEIILPDSCYPVYRIYANLFAARYQLARLHPENFHLDIAALKRQISNHTRALLVNSPSNPHGAVLSDEELAEICQLGVPTIFDEVYQALSLSDKKFPVPFIIRMNILLSIAFLNRCRLRDFVWVI
jgi:aspartate/methionine/tyrosine aminotransferase